ncbi:hypothetical protein DL768_004228 [Monosporascus sp. mg162]|nr:hypothetical protein DL768_004228 [Monosporascus sp. mg162]
MTRQDQTKKPLHLPHNEHKLYTEEPEDDDENWSNTPAENLNHQADTSHEDPFAHKSDGRPHRRPNLDARHDSNYFGYTAHANGQTVPYNPGDYTGNGFGIPHRTRRHMHDSNPNPFAPAGHPTAQPSSTLRPPNPNPPNQHIPGPYPAQPCGPNVPLHDPYAAVDPSMTAYPAIQYQGGQYQGGPYPYPAGGYPPGPIGPYPGASHYGVPHPPHHPTNPYVPVHRSGPSRTSHLQYEMDLLKENMDAFILNQQERDQRRQRAERKRAEAAAQKEKEKRDYEKMRRQVERRVKAEFSKGLLRLGESETQSDPGKLRASFDMMRPPEVMAPARHGLDDLRFREGGTDNASHEFAEFLEFKRRQEGLRSYAGSVRSLESAGREMFDFAPRGYFDGRADPGFRGQVEGVVIDLLRRRRLRVDEKEEQRLPLPPPQQHPGGYAGNDGQWRSRDWQPDSSSRGITRPATPASSHRAVYDHREDLSVDTNRPAARPPPAQGQGPYQDHGLGLNSRKPRAPRSDPSSLHLAQDLQRPRGVNHYGHSYEGAGQQGEDWDRLQGNPFTERPRPPVDGNYGPSPGRPASRGQPRGHRDPAGSAAHQGEFDSEDSDGLDVFPVRSSRYAMRPHHQDPPPTVPDAPVQK